MQHKLHYNQGKIERDELHSSTTNTEKISSSMDTLKQHHILMCLLNTSKQMHVKQLANSGDLHRNVVFETIYHTHYRH